MSLQHRDVVVIEQDGEEKEVFNWVNVSQPSVVRGGMAMEQFDAEIGAGDSSRTPEYVTEWVAEDLWHEFTIEVEKYGIEVVDVEAEDVRVL